MENNSRERVFLTVIETLASRICGGTLFEEDKTLHVPHHHTDIYKYHMIFAIIYYLFFYNNLFFALNTITFTYILKILYLVLFFCKKHFKSQKLTWGNKKSYLLFFFSFANFEKKPGYTVFIWTEKKMNFILNVFAFKINLIYIYSHAFQKRV